MYLGSFSISKINLRASFQVEVAPNRKYPGLSELRIVVSNETAASGVRAEGKRVYDMIYFTVNIFNFGYSDFPVFYPSLFDILYSFLGFNLEQGTKNEMSQKNTSF